MWQDRETEVDWLGQCDLMELAESVGVVPEPPPPPPQAATACCWGGLLAGDLKGCVALPEAPTGHFKHKVCARCTAHGIKVPLERLRALERDTQSFVNTGNQGPWTQPEGGGLFRLVNQTAKCHGPRLVVFQRTPPDDGTGWAPLPDAWVAGGYCRLVVSKGTFVPEELTRPTSRVLGSSAAATASFPAADGEPLPPEPPPPPLHDPQPKRSKRGSESLEVLLQLHEQLAAEVMTTLAQDRDSGGGGGGPPLPRSYGGEGALLGGAQSRGPGGEPRPSGSALRLGSAQREALEALSGALRTSAAALLRPETVEGEEEGGKAGEAGLDEPSLGLSFPPSPPLTASRPSSASAASAASAAGPSSSSSRWSSGLFDCLQDKWVCGLTLCCWPVVLAQLWQRSLPRRRAGRDLCVCLAVPLLAMWLFFDVLRVIEIEDGELRVSRLVHDNSLLDADSDHRLCYPRFGRRCAAMLAQLMTGVVMIVLIMLLRTVVRTRDGITGSAFRDCLVAVFCPGCGLCQLARHEGLVRGKYGGLLSPTGEKRAEVQALAV
eukprot:Transcript_17785.p1 GENE.Transcript_17785~~Transcript_17785.p1  ORF type:complete len:548 (+),score=69.85 Transcript_17785:136-1779(+)